MAGTQKRRQSNILYNVDGKMIIDIEEKLKIWKKYVEELFGDSKNERKFENTQKDEGPEIIKGEVECINGIESTISFDDSQPSERRWYLKKKKENLSGQRYLSEATSDIEADGLLKEYTEYKTKEGKSAQEYLWTAAQRTDAVIGWNETFNNLRWLVNIGHIDSINCKEYDVNFLKKASSKFVFLNVTDEATITIEDVVIVLPPPLNTGRTIRLPSSYRFGIVLSGYNTSNNARAWAKRTSTKSSNLPGRRRQPMTGSSPIQYQQSPPPSSSLQEMFIQIAEDKPATSSCDPPSGLELLNPDTEVSRIDTAAGSVRRRAACFASAVTIWRPTPRPTPAPASRNSTRTASSVKKPVRASDSV
ncbi:hypothetical protein ILUMI_02556 [Ignelater luminosus]|uniref:Uncharacterized protein n=1 Tax=Ignelater luminosus TaxID=2038154 RepID=A0A8K0DD82_IGNLU|nr:hypothetical protein ILUMI_02556 [Ignelater luminosus]